MQAAPPVVEPFPTPEIVVDGIAALGLSTTNIKIACFAERPALSGAQSERVVVCRLVMNISIAHAVALTLRSVLDDLEKRGVIPPLPTVNIT
jgi:hypothetical protein